MADNYLEIKLGIDDIKKEYLIALRELNENSFKEDREKRIKRKIKRLKELTRYYQELVYKSTTFRRREFLDFLKTYIALFENGLFLKEKTIIIKDRPISTFTQGMSTWAIGLNTKNPGLQLMGLNKARENPKTESYVSKQRIETYAYRNKIIFSFKPIIHLADGIKLKKKYAKYPILKRVFSELVTVALENPSLSPKERLNLVIENEKERRETRRRNKIIKTL